MRTPRPWVILIWDTSDPANPTFLILGYKTEAQAYRAACEMLGCDIEEDEDCVDSDGDFIWAVEGNGNPRIRIQQLEFPVE